MLGIIYSVSAHIKTIYIIDFGIVVIQDAGVEFTEQIDSLFEDRLADDLIRFGALC